MILEGAGGCMNIDRNTHRQASVRRGSDEGRRVSTNTPTTPISTSDVTCPDVPFAKDPTNKNI